MSLQTRQKKKHVAESGHVEPSWTARFHFKLSSYRPHTPEPHTKHTSLVVSRSQTAFFLLCVPLCGRLFSRRPHKIGKKRSGYASRTT